MCVWVGCQDTPRLGTSETQSFSPLAPAHHPSPAWTAALILTPQPPASGCISWAPCVLPCPSPCPYSLLSDASSTSSWGSAIYPDVPAGFQSPPDPITLMESNPLPSTLLLAVSGLPAARQDKVLSHLPSPARVAPDAADFRARMSPSSSWRRLEKALCLSPLTSG